MIIDGTFRVHQIFCSTLYPPGEVQRRNIPLDVSALPDRTRATYEAILILVQQAAHRINREFKPDTFLMDFELPMMSASRSIFPSSLIQGFYFHYTQALWRNCAGIWLKVFYSDPGVRKFIRSFLALPFIPSDQIHSALDIITQQRPPHSSTTHALLSQSETYFHRTWINGNNPPVIRNCYMNFELRTTNHVEGWHRLFNEKVKIAHPNIFVLIKALKNEERTTRNRMRELDNGHRPQPMKKV